MRQVALEGIDGSGKTSVANALSEQYAAEGLSSRVIAPYREANSMLGHDIYELWKTKTSARLAIKILQQVFEESYETALAEGVDVLIYDRHWLTAFTEIGNDKDLVVEWKTFVPAALLRVSPMVAMRRTNNDLDASWSNPEALSLYAQQFGIQARRNSEHMLGIYRSDDDVTPEAIARSIIWDMNIRR